MMRRSRTGSVGRSAKSFVRVLIYLFMPSKRAMAAITRPAKNSRSTGFFGDRRQARGAGERRYLLRGEKEKKRKKTQISKETKPSFQQRNKEQDELHLFVSGFFCFYDRHFSSLIYRSPPLPNPFSFFPFFSVSRFPFALKRGTSGF